MKFKFWKRWSVLLLPFALSMVVFAGLVFSTLVQPVLADGEPWTVQKFAEPAEVAPGGTVKYSIVLSRSVGTLVTPIYIFDHYDALLSANAASVSITPPGSALFDASTPGYITFTVYNLSSVITMTFDATLNTSAASGDVISNTSVVSDAANIASSNVATFTVSQPPDLQIYSPADAQIITQHQGTVLAVTGRAWGVFDPAPFPAVPTLDPITNFDGAGTYNVTWSAVADAANYVLQESLNPNFTSYTQYAVVVPTTSQFVSGKSVGTYYYRVAAYNAAARPSRWSNVEPVTVTGVSLLSEPLEGLVDAGAAMPTSDIVSVIVSVDGGSVWSPATVTENPGGWWDWTYNWTLPEADNVAYPLTARAAYVGGGGYGEDTVTVTVDNNIKFVYLPLSFRRWPPVPYAPTLSATTPDTSGSFTVSWVYGGHSSITNPTGYFLQEATNLSFTDATEYSMGLTIYRAFTKAPGTYYYRVRGQNSYGFGDWSNTVTVVVVAQSRYYYFDTAGNTEGWGVKRWDATSEELDDYKVKVMNGSLYTYLWGRFDEMQLSPMQEGPTVPYTVTGRVKLVHNETIDGFPYTAKNAQAYGLLFGGNYDTPCPADRYTAKGDGCLSHYYRLLVSYSMGDGSFIWSLKRVDYHDPDNNGKGDGLTLIDWKSADPDDVLGWNEWKVTVTNSSYDNIKVYLNGTLLGKTTDHTYLSSRYFGTMMVSPDFGQVGAKWDWYKIVK
jgi:hypothetical protein